MCSSLSRTEVLDIAKVCLIVLGRRFSLPQLICRVIFLTRPGLFFKMEVWTPTSASRGCTQPFLLDYSQKPYKRTTKISDWSHQIRDKSLHLRNWQRGWTWTGHVPFQHTDTHHLKWKASSSCPSTADGAVLNGARKLVGVLLACSWWCKWPASWEPQEKVWWI
jgi:hypothetical protein